MASGYGVLSELRALAAAWDESFPRRARGGSNALSGFNYQFMVVLLETVQSWLNAAEDERAAPNVFSEMLSDVVQMRGDDGLVVTQAKRRYSRSSVRSALDELWTIRQVASRSLPDVLPKLRFRLLAATGELDPARRTVAEWEPQDGAVAADVADFRGAVEVALLWDPQTQLLAVLANKLRAVDPLRYVNTWLGALARIPKQ